MEKEFVPYPLAIKMKVLGFNKPCFGGWSHPFENNKNGFLQLNQECEYDIKAPTYHQAFKWFRDEHNLFGKVYIINFGSDEYSFDIYDLYEEKEIYDNFIGSGASYCGTYEKHEEAELACIEKLLDIVEDKIKEDGKEI